jgi:hypothetical protein
VRRRNIRKHTMYEEKVNSKEDQSARPTYYIHPSTLSIFKVSGPSFLCSYLEALVSLFLFRKSFCIVLNHVLDHFVAQFSFAGDQLAPDTFQEQLLESSAYMHQPLYKIVLAAKIQIRPQQIRRKNSGTCRAIHLLYCEWKQAPLECVFMIIPTSCFVCE